MSQVLPTWLADDYQAVTDGIRVLTMMGLAYMPVDVLDVRPPSVRVTGEPGDMRVVRIGCSTLGLDDTRRRIVDEAVQEWAFFGFSVVDETVDEPRGRQRGARPNPEESVRADRKNKRGVMTTDRATQVAVDRMTVVAVANAEGKIVLETVVPTAAKPIRELTDRGRNGPRIEPLPERSSWTRAGGQSLGKTLPAAVSSASSRARPGY